MYIRASFVSYSGHLCGILSLCKEYSWYILSFADKDKY